VEIPPLRERADDIAELASHFVAVAARVEGKAKPELSPETLRVLAGHTWPGNVRELENVVRRAVVLSDVGRIEPSHSAVAREVAGGGRPGVGGHLDGNLLKAVEMLERRMILDALEKNGWVKAKAARTLA